MRFVLMEALADLATVGTGYIRPSSYEIALFVKNPNGSYHELVDANYARRPVLLAAGHWSTPAPGQRAVLAEVRFPATGLFAGSSLKIGAVAFFAPGHSQPDFVHYLPGGFDLPTPGFLLFPPDTLRISLTAPGLTIQPPP